MITLQIREAGKPISQILTDIPQVESVVTVINGAPGLTNLFIDVNGARFSTGRLADNEEKSLDILSAMMESDNTITLKGWGKPGASATIMIWDGGGMSSANVKQAARRRAIQE